MDNTNIITIMYTVNIILYKNYDVIIIWEKDVCFCLICLFGEKEYKKAKFPSSTVETEK